MRSAPDEQQSPLNAEANRRTILAAGATLTVGTQLPAVSWAASNGPGSEISRLDAVGQAELIRSGKISAVEAVDIAIARAEAVQPRLNCLVLTDFERARDKAKLGRSDGPFAGVPFLISNRNFKAEAGRD